MLINQSQQKRGKKLFGLAFFTFPFLYYFFRHISEDDEYRLRNAILSTSIVILFTDIVEGRMERKELTILSIVIFLMINITGYTFEYLILQNKMFLSFNIILSLSSCIGDYLLTKFIFCKYVTYYKYCDRARLK